MAYGIQTLMLTVRSQHADQAVAGASVVHLAETLLDVRVDGMPLDERTADAVAAAVMSSDWLRAVRARAVAEAAFDGH